ncbi:hypothetical protein [Buttiauxella brennerae]|nr:hypothetical protein [Buttiauxella brennerae]
MNAIEITNGEYTPVVVLAEIMYAAYQLHGWLKTVEIGGLYQLPR